jgi:hypothetical protein
MACPVWPLVTRPAAVRARSVVSQLDVSKTRARIDSIESEVERRMGALYRFFYGLKSTYRKHSIRSSSLRKNYVGTHAYRRSRTARQHEHGSQAAQKVRPARPQRVKARGVPLGYVEGLNDARTLLADFFSSLLGLAGGLRLFAIEFGPAIIEPLCGCAGGV